MGVTLISAIIAIISIICLIIYHNTSIGDWCEFIGLSGAIVGGAAAIILSVCAIIASSNANLCYMEMVEKKATIEYRLEKIENDDTNILVNGGIYNDILEYNNEIRYYRKWGRNNFWIGWFNPAPIDELELIELDKGA